MAFLLFSSIFASVDYFFLLAAVEVPLLRLTGAGQSPRRQSLSALRLGPAYLLPFLCRTSFEFFVASLVILALV